METFTFAMAVRGYHVFQDLFKPSIRERLVEMAYNVPILIYKNFNLALRL